MFEVVTTLTTSLVPKETAQPATPHSSHSCGMSSRADIRTSSPMFFIMDTTRG